MGIKRQVRCPTCGWDRPPHALGLDASGAFDPAHAQPNELSFRVDHFGGRGRITVEREPLTPPFAIGLRNMLRARLAQVEAELRAAGLVP